MQAAAEITPWHWVGFIAFVVLLLALDLGYFHRDAREVKYKEALAWTMFWVLLAVVFAVGLIWFQGKRPALEFFTGYAIELSLSMDNLLVIAIIFSYFRVPLAYQHRVLFWGILGALVMRGVMIGLGIVLIRRFEWILYVFGAFIVLAGIRMLLTREADMNLERSLPLRIARKLLPVTREFDGQKFVTRFDGRKMLTPLFLVLLLVEMSDLVFAMDSIPAIFGVTRKPFIVFTCNVFAILGLRSLYSVLAGAIGFFRYLKFGLSVILIFIGVKMLIEPRGPMPHWYQYDIPDLTALLVVVTIIAVAILASMITARRETQLVKS
jgi:tellurite resistance protein TerC